MTDIREIRRREDGSIDTGYYLDKGRSRRSETANEMAGHAARKMRNMLVGLIAFFAFLFLGSQASPRSVVDAGS